MRMLPLLLPLLLLVALDAGAADPRDSDRAALSGLGSVLVLVKTDDATSVAGVDAAAIGSEITASLRAAGVTVHDSMPEAREKSGSDFAILVADVAVAGGPDASGRLVYDVDLEVKQMATLIRDPDRRALAVTWRVSTLDTGPLPSLRAAIAALTTRFLDDYRASHPAGS